MLGHLLGAAGAVEAVAVIQAIQTGVVSLLFPVLASLHATCSHHPNAECGILQPVTKQNTARSRSKHHSFAISMARPPLCGAELITISLSFWHSLRNNCRPNPNTTHGSHRQEGMTSAGAELQGPGPGEGDVKGQRLRVRVRAFWRDGLCRLTVLSLLAGPALSL